MLTNAFFGPLIMLGVLYMIYQITFEVGAYPQGWVEDGFAWLGDFCTSVLPEAWPSPWSWTASSPVWAAWSVSCPDHDHVRPDLLSGRQRYMARMAI